MKKAGSGTVLRFPGHELDVARGCLRGPDGAEVPLPPKPFDLLVVLARNAGRTMSKEALLDAVWPGVHVTEDSLFQAVREVRRAIGDEAGQVFSISGKALGTTTCGLGVCRHTVQNCVGGQPQICNPMEGAGPELCDGLDNDCNGVADYPGGEVDNDGDGVLSCRDCDDNDPSISPNVYDNCNGIDNDCDGIIDDDCNITDEPDTDDPGPDSTPAGGSGSTDGPYDTGSGTDTMITDMTDEDPAWTKARLSGGCDHLPARGTGLGAGLLWLFLRRRSTSGAPRGVR